MSMSRTTVLYQQEQAGHLGLLTGGPFPLDCHQVLQEDGGTKVEAAKYILEVMLPLVSVMYFFVMAELYCCLFLLNQNLRQLMCYCCVLLLLLLLRMSGFVSSNLDHQNSGTEQAINFNNKKLV
jgi:hypothetical protein